MGEHASFIRGMLDPSENMLISKANDFVGQFDKLFEETRRALDQTGMVSKVTADKLKATRELRDFKAQGIQGILECKVRSIILPLLNDHVLREANHYLRELTMYSRG